MALADGLEMLENRYILVLNLTFPGIFVLETIFQIGLFSGGVENLYRFILLVLWSVALSIPYAAASAIQFRLDQLLHLPEGDSLRPGFGFAIKFPLHFAGAVMTTIIFKILASTGLFTWVEPAIPAIHIQYVVSLVIACLFGYPVASIYRRILKRPIVLDSMQRIQDAGMEGPDQPDQSCDLK